jgi:uncharacterized protein GlcG (DUF336 family)
MQELTLGRALKGIEAALAHARARAMAPIAVVVLDGGGHVRACAREDGSGNAGVEIAAAKGRGALNFGVSSRAIGDFLGGNALLGASLAATLNGQMLPIPGAIIFHDSAGRAAGAIAAAGDAPDNDEAAALAGLAAMSQM